MYLDLRPDCGHYELRTITALIFNTLQQRCLDRSGVFSGVFAASEGSLFDRLLVNPAQAALSLDDWMREKINNDIGDSIAVYPLFRVIASSEDLGFERLEIVRPDDAKRWAALDPRGGFERDWSPLTGQFVGGSGGGFQQPFDSWLVGRYRGSCEGIKQAFRRDAQEAMACLYAFWSRDAERERVMTSPEEYFLALHRPETGGARLHLLPLGPMFPRYGDELDLHSLQPQVRDWNEKRRGLPAEYAKRLSTGLCFANLAMASYDVSIFINYFIVLDALFGERGQVESSLVSGVSDVSGTERAGEMLPWLWSLRNDLMHGGSRNIHEWSSYLRYLKHFGTEPLSDLRAIALNCLCRYPMVMSSKSMPP